METVTAEKVAADIAWQVESLLISAAVSVIATTPIAGALVYAGLNILKGYLDIREQKNIIRAHTFHSEDYRGTEVLSDDWIFDDWFGGMMTTGLTGNQYGVYMPVIYETRKHRYEGQLILAPYSDEKKTTTTLAFNSENIWDMFDSNINNINLDYSLQSRSYMGYSDLDDVRLIKFFKESGLDETNEVMYAPNSITYLENEIARTSDENNDYFMDTVLPYMHDYYPIMTFVDSEQYASLPEFYEDYPIIVSDEVYEDKLKDQYDRFFKVWERSDEQEFRIIPKNSPHTIKADIEYIEVYIVTYKEEFFVTYKHIDTIAKDDYEFDEVSGKLVFEKDIIDDFNDAIDKKEQANNYYDYCIILEFFVEKYRSIDDTGELTSEQMEQIATMQSIQASVLEYYYQFQLATESQQKLNEIAYTVVITVISTAITLGIGSATGIAKGSLIGLATEPLEEVFIDPLIESVSTGITRELGGDQYAELIVSTLAESARESQFGIFATQQQYQQKKALKAQGYNDVEIRQIMKGKHEQVILQKEEQSTARKVAKAALLTLSIFSLASLGIGGSMLFGSLGTMGFATASAFLIASGKLSFKDSFSVAIDKESLADIFEHVKSGMLIGDPLEGLFPAWDDPVYNGKLYIWSEYMEYIAFGGMEAGDPIGISEFFEVSDFQKSRQKPTQEFWQKFVEQIMEKTGKTYIDLARQAQYGDKRMETLLKNAYGTPKTIMVARGERDSSDIDETRPIFNRANKKGIFSTMQLIDNICEELAKIVPKNELWRGKLADYKVGTFLGQSQNFLKHTRDRIKNINPDYTFSKELLMAFIDNLYYTFGQNAKKCIDNINQYMEKNQNLKEYSKQQYQIHNPDLKADYFDVIDSIEEAYWLGFLCADGSITSGRTNKIRYQIAIELSIKDKDQLIKFCESIGLNPDKIGERDREIDGKVYRTTYIEFTCKPMYETLERIKFKGSPQFSNREYLLGWLLGFYDGDGISKRTDICSSDRHLLEQIKDKFNIRYEVKLKLDPNDLSDDVIIKTNKPLWRLALGATLFNELLRNYKYSLERKRHFMDEYREVYENLKVLIGNKDNLQKLVENFPKQLISDELGINIKTLSKLMKEWEVTAPIQKKNDYNKIQEILPKYLGES